MLQTWRSRTILESRPLIGDKKMNNKAINLGCVLIAFTLPLVASANETAAAHSAVNDPSVVQTRVSGVCTVGSFITAVAENGSVSCSDGGDADGNTRYGESALSSNTGRFSTATGFSALAQNTDGSANTATGAFALAANLTGRVNTATGAGALEENTTGSANTANGLNALLHNTEGGGNTAIGVVALRENTDGGSNTAIGVAALFGNTTGWQNTATGVDALRSNDVGIDNAAYGVQALSANTTGVNNTSIGAFSMIANEVGSENTAVGQSALHFGTGPFNTAIGASALWSSTSGSNNIALGWHAGFHITDGGFNIAIGNGGDPADNNTIRIGNANHHRTFVAGVEGVMTGINDAVTVVIDSNGQLGTVSSSARYKEDINDMGAASERLLQLRPVTFQYKEAYANGATPQEFGLIAEEVAQVFPELVIMNEDNQPETVKYRLLSSLLLNELQKQSSELQTLSGQVAEIEDLKVQVAELSQLVGRLSD